MGEMSQQRAGVAMKSGFLAKQIAPIEVAEGRKNTRLMENDEFPRPDITIEKLAKLKPVFRKEGRITPGNSSGVTDGAAFVVIGDRKALERKEVKPIVGSGLDYRWSSTKNYGIGPVPAIKALWEKRGLKPSDIDYYEINEAFAVVNLHAERN